MSQFQTDVTMNLNKFARYMKKGVILTFIVIGGSLLLLILGLFGGFWDLLLLIGFALLAAGITLIIFQILQLSLLSRAKNASSDPLLTSIFNLRLSALIALGVAILSFYTFFLPILLVFINLVLTIFGYNALIKFAEKNYSFPRKARQGFLLFTISLLSGIVLSLALIPSIFNWDLLIMAFLGIILALILTFSGQSLLAHGLLEVFTTAHAIDAPSSLHKEPGEPTFQSYGAPTSTLQPSESTFRHPSPSSPSSDRVGYLKTCPTCGNSLMDGAKFCGQCGSVPTPILQPSDSTHLPPSHSSPPSDRVGKIKICSMCGTSLMDGVVFCPNCGLNQ